MLAEFYYTCWLTITALVKSMRNLNLAKCSCLLGNIAQADQYDRQVFLVHLPWMLNKYTLLVWHKCCKRLGAESLLQHVPISFL